MHVNLCSVVKYNYNIGMYGKVKTDKDTASFKSFALNGTIENKSAS